jgi:hypothetical protein
MCIHKNVYVSIHIYAEKFLHVYVYVYAFENSIEDGYVTEKPFDALISGEYIY